MEVKNPIELWGVLWVISSETSNLRDFICHVNLIRRLESPHTSWAYTKMVMGFSEIDTHEPNCLGWL
jgi:hypothetical protein